jgi:succinate dehydrogenase / fumarate reductase cytochrome b subunit
MAASIAHRTAGLALYAGTILLAAWTFAVAQGGTVYAPVGAFIASPIGVLFLFLYAWALLFHTLNGLRHLYWDMGRGLEMRSATLTAWYVFAGSFFGALLIVAAGISARGA